MTEAFFTEIDDFMDNIEQSCRHRWLTIGAVVIGFHPKSKKPVFATMSQCKDCKELLLGDIY